MKCPKCSEDCDRDEVDVGVGVVYGPWGCPACGWSEYPGHDLSDERDPADSKGGVIDQYGGYHPPGSPKAETYALARRLLTPRPPSPIMDDK